MRYGIFWSGYARSCPTTYLLVGAMSDDLAGLAATYMRYQGGCSDNLKRSIRRKAEHMILACSHIISSLAAIPEICKSFSTVC